MKIFEAVRLEEQNGIAKLGWFIDTTRSECACGILIHLPSYFPFWAFSRHGQFKLSRQLFNDHNGNNLTSSSEDGGLKVSQKSHGKLWYANSC